MHASFTDDTSVLVGADSAATATKVVDNSSLSVAISGTAREGATLTATPTIGDSDDTGATVSYQWLISTDGGLTWLNIPDATASTYVVAEGDENLSVGVRASFTDDTGQLLSAYSAPTATKVVDNSSLSVSFTGTAKEGATLTAMPPTIGDSDDTGATVSYQWQSSTDGSSWSNISTATGTTYVVAEGDENKFVRVHASFTDDTGQLVSADSAPTASKVVDNSSLSVAVSGNSTMVGSSVTALPTVGDSDDASSTISYQWQSSTDNGGTWNPISGGTGSSYVVHATDGNKLLRVHASFTDDTNQLVTADSISFNGPVVPDLTVSGISAAGSIASGDMLSFSYIIKNIGGGDDTVSSWAGVFLDNNFATTFRNNTWNLIGPILAGNTVRTSNSISTVGLALGDHTLTVEADYWNDATGMKNNGSDDVAESNETNNATTIHFTVQQAAAPAALPDLVVDSITNLSVVNQGDAFSFSYVIKDIGTGDVHAASWAGIFLDGQATTLFGGTSPSGWNYISAMAAGGSVTASNSFSTAGLLGSHTLTIEADYWNDATGMTNNGSDDVAESNEGNNSTTIHFTVNAPVAPALPDLVVDSITPNAASVHQGDNFSFSYVVKDIGTGPVNTASWGGIFLDGQATTIFGGTSPSGWNRIGPMAAGASVTALNSFSTAGLSLGDHTVTVEADYWNDAANMANGGNNDITESNESNNTTTIHFTVTAPALPDLVIDSITPSATSVALGQSLNFSYVVKDIGAGEVHANSWAGIFLDGQATTIFGGTSPSGWNRIGPMAAGASVTAAQQLQHRRAEPRRPYPHRQGGLLERRHGHAQQRQQRRGREQRGQQRDDNPLHRHRRRATGADRGGERSRDRRVRADG